MGDSIEEIEEEELVLVTNPQLEHAWRDYNNKPQNIHEITIQFHSDLLSDQILNRNQMISIRELSTVPVKESCSAGRLSQKSVRC